MENWIMTLEELNKYRGMVVEINLIKDQINNLYNTYKSPSFTDVGLSSSNAVSPVEKAVNKIQRLEGLYAEKLFELEKQTHQIEYWISSIDDPYIRAIIRSHYLLGKSWKDTSKLVYGYGNYYNARKVVYRYFGRE